MEFKPGFRFSMFDAAILIAALLLVFFTHSYGLTYSVLVIFVILHFFLFCNIVRMSRIPELIWASFFLLAFYFHLKLSAITFVQALVSCISVTFILIFLEVIKPSYHGVFWKKLNPKLSEWFSENKKRNV